MIRSVLGRDGDRVGVVLGDRDGHDLLDIHGREGVLAGVDVGRSLEVAAGGPVDDDLVLSGGQHPGLSGLHGELLVARLQILVEGELHVVLGGVGHLLDGVLLVLLVSDVLDGQRRGCGGRGARHAPGGVGAVEDVVVQDPIGTVEVRGGLDAVGYVVHGGTVGVRHGGHDVLRVVVGELDERQGEGQVLVALAGGGVVLVVGGDLPSVDRAEVLRSLPACDGEGSEGDLVAAVVGVDGVGSLGQDDAVLAVAVRGGGELESGGAHREDDGGLHSAVAVLDRTARLGGRRGGEAQGVPSGVDAVVDAVPGDRVDGVGHRIGGESHGDVELAVVAEGQTAVGSAVDGDRHGGRGSREGHGLRLVGGHGDGLVAAGRVLGVRVHGHQAVPEGDGVLPGDHGDDGLAVVSDLLGELGPVARVGGDDDGVGLVGGPVDRLAVDVVHRGGDRLRGRRDGQTLGLAGVDREGSGAQGGSGLAVERVGVGSGQDSGDGDASVGDIDALGLGVALELEHHLLGAVDLVADLDRAADDGLLDDHGGLGIDGIEGDQAQVADLHVDPVGRRGDQGGVLPVASGGGGGEDDLLSVGLIVIVDVDGGAADRFASGVDLSVVGGGAADPGVLEHDDRVEVVDHASVGLLLLHRLVGIHVLPSVAADGGLVVGVVHDQPLSDRESGQTVSGDGLRGSVLAVAEGQGDEVAVGAAVARLGGGGSDHGPPEGRVVDGAGVVGGAVVRVVGVELGRRAVLVELVVGEVGDGREAVPVAVLQGEHGSVEDHVSDLAAGQVADLVVGVHDLLLVHPVGHGVDRGEVDGILLGEVRFDLSVRVGVGPDLLDCGGGVLDERPDLVVDGRGREAGGEVGVRVGEHDAEHHGGDGGSGAVREIHLRGRGGSASDGVGDGIELALGDGVVGVVDPGHDGAVLVGVPVVIPDVPHGVGVAGLDGEGGVAGVEGVPLGVGGLSRVDGEAEVGDDDEQGDDEDGHEREGLDHLPEASGHPGGLDVGGPVPDLGLPEHSHDDRGGPDGEHAADDGRGGVAGPGREEHDEQPDDHEELGRGAVPPQVDVGLVDGEADREPHGQPAVVGGDVGHGHVAVGELLHYRTRVDRVPEDEIVVHPGGCDGEGRAEHQEDDDQCGDRDHPGLLPEGHEDEGEHDGDDGDEDGSGVDGVHEAGRHVVRGGDEGPDEDHHSVPEGRVGEVLAPDAGGDGLEDHRDCDEDDRDTEAVPGEGGQHHEDPGDRAVDQDGLPRGLLGIQGLDHLHGEVRHESDEEGGQGILVAAGEDRGADREGHERDDQGSHYTYRLVEHLLADQIDRDAQKSPEDGIQHSQGHRSGLGGTHASAEDGSDARRKEVHEGRDVQGTADGIVDGRIRHGPGAIEDAFDHMQMVLCTRTAGQGEIPIRGNAVGEHETQQERYDHDDAQDECTPVATEPPVTAFAVGPRISGGGRLFSEFAHSNKSPSL